MNPSDLAGWNLVFRPTLAYPAGEYWLYMVARLPAPFTAATRQPFKVLVQECVATIDISAVTLPAMSNVWYSDPQTYDISSISSQIVQTPNCEYDYAYAAYWVIPNDPNLYQLPAEVSF